VFWYTTVVCIFRSRYCDES